MPHLALTISPATLDPIPAVPPMRSSLCNFPRLSTSYTFSLIFSSPSPYLGASTNENWIVVSPIFKGIAAGSNLIPALECAPDSVQCVRGQLPDFCMHNCPASPSSPDRPNSLTLVPCAVQLILLSPMDTSLLSTTGLISYGASYKRSPRK